MLKVEGGSRHEVGPHAKATCVTVKVSRSTEMKGSDGAVVEENRGSRARAGRVAVWMTPVTVSPLLTMVKGESIFRMVALPVMVYPGVQDGGCSVRISVTTNELREVLGRAAKVKVEAAGNEAWRCTDFAPEFSYTTLRDDTSNGAIKASDGSSRGMSLNVLANSPASMESATSFMDAGEIRSSVAEAMSWPGGRERTRARDEALTTTLPEM
mmetsp:Transcript_42617/g.70917  ORF Transcript_42617/g.70917 Transcript_42617/m.70917 type:complete len:212 (-) Transcript_42617:1015-1650(-)